jgi:hypothetical protein
MTANAPAMGVSAAIVAHHHPVTQGWVPPPVMLRHQLGESSCTGIRLGLFLYRDVILCLLTGVEHWFPHHFPPRQ